MDLPALLQAAARVIGWTLVHFLWQGTLLGVIYALLRALLPRGEASYRLGMGMLVAFAVCPLLTAWRLLQQTPALIHAATHLQVSLAITEVSAADIRRAWDGGVEALLPWLVLAWLAGVLLLSLRAWQQWREMQACVRAAAALPQWHHRVAAMARRLGLRHGVVVRCSKVIATPVLVGWLRPVILLPMAVVCGFPAAQIELILAHELAHVRRWDPLANLFQVMLETLHFYHPVVRWISREVRNEREICCDQLALAATGGSPQQFAQTLAELGELRQRHGALLLAANGGVLLDRVQQLVLSPQERARTPARFVALWLGVALLALTLHLEWKQARMQRMLADSITQLQAVLAPSWSPLVRFAAPSQPADLALKHAEAARLWQGQSPAGRRADAIEPPLPTADSLPLPRQPSPRVSDVDLPGAVRLMPVTAVIPRATSSLSAAAPTALYMRQPIYPQAALMRGIQGEVVVEFGLAGDGRVEDLRVISATPAGVFERAAMQTMRGWRYSVTGAAPSQRRYRQTIAFALNAVRGQVASAAPASETINARVSCQITTGTHICRWPEAQESLHAVKLGNSVQP